MKKIAMTLSVATMLIFSACGDNADKEGQAPGQKATDEPVMNSGPETEADRAKEAIKDSADADAGADSTVSRDADAPSTPH